MQKDLNLIDANIFLRYLTWDVPSMAERCKGLFKRLEFGQEDARVLDITIAEVVWTLQKFFGLEKKRISEILKPIINFKGLKTENKEALINALTVYANSDVDFPDAYISEISKRVKTKVYSYDRDIDSLGAERIEP